MSWEFGGQHWVQTQWSAGVSLISDQCLRREVIYTLKHYVAFSFTVLMTVVLGTTQRMKFRCVRFAVAYIIEELTVSTRESKCFPRKLQELTRTNHPSQRTGGRWKPWNLSYVLVIHISKQFILTMKQSWGLLKPVWSVENWHLQFVIEVRYQADLETQTYGSKTNPKTTVWFIVGTTLTM